MAKRNQKILMWRFLEVDDVIIGPIEGQGPTIVYPDVQHKLYAALHGKKFKTDDDLIDAVRKIEPSAYRVAIRVDDGAVIKLLDQLGIDIPMKS